MTRISALLWLLLVVGSGFATFKAKYAVQDLEDQLHRVQKQTVAEQQEIRVLNAEWTYLTQPERLADLNRRFLSLAPVTTKQLQTGIEDIPMRPPPAPETLVAAASGPQMPQMPMRAAASQTVAAAPQTTASVAAAPKPAMPQRPPVAAASQTAASRPPVVAAAFNPATAAARLQVAKGAPASSGSLNALIAQIADSR